MIVLEGPLEHNRGAAGGETELDAAGAAGRGGGSWLLVWLFIVLRGDPGVINPEASIFLEKRPSGHEFSCTKNNNKLSKSAPRATMRPARSRARQEFSRPTKTKKIKKPSKRRASGHEASSAEQSAPRVFPPYKNKEN